MAREKRRGLSNRTVLLIAAGVVAVAVLLFFLLYRGLKGAMDGDGVSNQYAAAFLTALDQGDEAAAYDLLFPGSEEPGRFARQFSTLREVWLQNGGGPDFALKKTSWSWHTSSANGASRTTVDCVYRVVCGEAVFQVQMSREESGAGEGITGLRLNTAAQEAAGALGNLFGDLAPRGVGGWMGLIWHLACLALVVSALVDCLRKARRHKGLWVALILLLNITFTFRVNAAAARFVISVGAILYWCRRKGLTAPPTEELPPPASDRGEDPWDAL